MGIKGAMTDRYRDLHMGIKGTRTDRYRDPHIWAYGGHLSSMCRHGIRCKQITHGHKRDTGRQIQISPYMGIKGTQTDRHIQRSPYTVWA